MAKKITIMGIDFDVDGEGSPDPVSAILGPMPKQEATKMEDVLFGGEKTVRHMKPKKRKSTGKVKARGSGRRGKIFYSPDAYNYFKGNDTLSHHVTNSANVILSDGRVVTVSDNPRIYDNQLDYTAYIRGDTNKGQAVYGSTPVARRQVAETYIKNNTPKPTVLNTCDKAAMAYYDSLAKKSSSGSSRCSCGGSRSGASGTTSSGSQSFQNTYRKGTTVRTQIR